MLLLVHFSLKTSRLPAPLLSRITIILKIVIPFIIPNGKPHIFLEVASLGLSMIGHTQMAMWSSFGGKVIQDQG